MTSGKKNTALVYKNVTWMMYLGLLLSETSIIYFSSKLGQNANMLMFSLTYFLICTYIST